MGDGDGKCGTSAGRHVLAGLEAVMMLDQHPVGRLAGQSRIGQDRAGGGGESSNHEDLWWRI